LTKNGFSQSPKKNPKRSLIIRFTFELLNQLSKKNFTFSKKIVHFFGFKILSLEIDLSLRLREVCSEKELLTAMNCTPFKKGYIRLEKLFMISRSMKAINI